MEVSFAKKEATVHYDAQKTKASEALARLTAESSYSGSKLASLGAEFDGDYAKVAAHAVITKKGATAKLVIALEPKEGHALNGEGQADLEIEAKAAKGTTFKEPVLKDKAGVSKKPRDFTIEFDVDPNAAAGEVVVALEVRMVDVKGKERTSRVVQLGVPILIP